MSTAAALVELTQASLSKLRSSEFNMRIVQLQSPSTAAAASSTATTVSVSDVDVSCSMWKHKYEQSDGAGAAAAPFPVSLPVVLVEYFKALQSDGLHFAASVSRSGGGAAAVPPPPAPTGESTVAPISYVCICRLNRISEIAPVKLSASEALAFYPQDQLKFHAATVAAAVGGGGGGDASTRGGGAADIPVLHSPRVAGNVRCFMLSPAAAESGVVNGVDGPRSPLCEVLLVFRERGTASNNPEVWAKNMQTCRYFYLCRTVEDYIRLGCRMFWIAGWQLCFDEEQGPPDWALPWLRMLCPGPLAQALSIVR